MKTKRPKNTTLYVANLNFKVDEGQILGLFKKYGYVNNIKILREGKESRSRGVAFVELNSLDAANKAIANVNGLAHQGRTLKVVLADNQNFVAKN